jgi:hypothetical protein
MSTQGAPSKYTYCVAENVEANPWEPLHIERGFQADQSTVTVLAGEPPHNINDHSGSTAEDILTIISGAISITGANNAYTGGETLLALGPEHAATIAGDGFGKREIREWLHKNARIPLERYTHETMMERFQKIPNGPVPMVVDPDLLMIIVLGAHLRRLHPLGYQGDTAGVTADAIPGDLLPRHSGEGRNPRASGARVRARQILPKANHRVTALD